VGGGIADSQGVEEEFDDLDMIVARYVDPLVKYVQAVQEHPKHYLFKEGSPEALEELKKKKEENPKYVSGFFWWCEGETCDG
jgi:hypothetical protein